jgi:hypothetical protein
MYIYDHLFINSVNTIRLISKALRLTTSGNVLDLLRSDTTLATSRTMVLLRSHKMSYSTSIPKGSNFARSKILWMRSLS